MPLFQRSNSRKKSARRAEQKLHQGLSLKPGMDYASLYSSNRSKTGKNRRFQSTIDWLPKPKKKMRKVEASTYRVSPSVMARSVQRSSPIATKRSKNTRRRVDVPLGGSGLEMRLPALPRIAFGWRLVSFAIAGVLCLALYYAWTSPTFQVSEPELMGLKLISASEMNALLGITGKPIFALDKDEIQQTLSEAFPEIAAASVMINLPNTVAITVTERLPVIAWSQNGTVMLVEEDGTAFPQRNQAATAGLMQVEASSPPPAPAQATLQSLDPEQALLEMEEQLAQPQQTVAQGAQPFTTPEMVAALRSIANSLPDGATLVYDDRHGLGWKDAGGWIVYLGDTRDIDMKMTVYTALLAQLDHEDIMPSMISLEQVDSPYFQEKITN